MACTCSSCLDHTSTNHHVDIYPFSLGSHHAILSRGNLLFYISDMFDRYFCAQLQRSTTLTSRLTPPCHFRHIVEGSRKIYVVFLDGDVRSLASYNIKERIEIWYWHILLIDFWTQKKANFTFLRTRVRRVRIVFRARARFRAKLAWHVACQNFSPPCQLGTDTKMIQEA